MALATEAIRSAESSAPLPSPLVGEGARRADEGGAKVGRARALRQRTTEAEKRMWFLLRDRRFDALKFRRQVPIGRYVADFACYEAKVIIELDGSRHAGSLTDKVRDVDLRARGFEVVRVWNNELFLEPDAVMRAISMAIERQTGSGR